MPKTYYMLSLFVLLFSCSQNSENEKLAKENSLSIPAKQPTEVSVAVAQKGNFTEEILSNGKVKAFRTAELRFEATGVVQEIGIKNGLQVSENQILVRLSPEKFELALQQALNGLEKAEIQRRDMFLEYIGRDTASLPAQIKKTIDVRSGYKEARLAVTKATMEMKNARLKAPFAGKIADLKVSQWARVNQGDICCTLIDDRHFEVEFLLIESEIQWVSIGQKVELCPFSTDSLRFLAQVTEINPRVNENGLVSVKAKTPGATPELLDGMNVKVTLQRQIPNTIIVPKQALIQRSGRDVIFVFENGRALWRDVEITGENSSQIAVKKGIAPGEKVIVENNVHLAHDAQVKIKQAEKEQ